MNEFKLIVAGGRDFTDKALLESEILHLINGALKYNEVSIVSGMARGADRLAWEFAKRNGIVCHEFYANWDRHGKAAGYRRNSEMGAFSDGLLLFWDGRSKGSGHMLNIMRKLNKPIKVVMY